jgi:hypothetical protein
MKMPAAAYTTTAESLGGTKMTKVRESMSWALVLILAVGMGGCCEAIKKQQLQRETDAARRAQDERDRQEKLQIMRAPDDALDTSNIVFYDEGIINDYRTLSSVTVLNKSRFALTNLRGEIDWLDGQGAKFGSMPFSITGSIPAGDTKTFTKGAGTLANGTLRGKASKARIRFTSAQLVGGI